MADSGARPLVRFLSHGAERSGPPIYLLRLLRSWSRSAPPFRPEVVLARPGPLQQEFAQSAPTWCARLDRRSPERVAARAATAARAPSLGDEVTRRATRARVPNHHPELTVVNGATSPTVALLDALDPKGPVVTIAHELSTGWFSNLAATERSLLLERSAGFLAVSHAVESFLIDALGVPQGRVHVIHPPVDLAELGCRTDLAVAGDPRPTVVGAGMTDWRKAPESWLRVARLVKDHMDVEGLRFRWFGGASTGDPGFWPVQHEMEHLGLVDDVEFLGQIDRPRSVLEQADVFLTTSREDAFPLACAEALGSGVPVVGFDLDGVAEMVSESGAGALVPYPDEAALARQVVTLLDDRDLRAELGRRGRSYAASCLAVDVVGPAVERWLMEAVA